MKRRARPGDLPEHLSTFRGDDWLGRTWDERFAFWREARRAYLDAHGWPGGPLAMLRDESDLQRRRHGWRLRPFDRTPEQLADLEAQRSR